MKNGLKHIVGKRIAAVVVAENDRDPRQQVFLVFGDGQCFELYGERFTCCSSLDDAAQIERSIESAGGRIMAVYGEWDDGGAPASNAGTLEALMRRDLAAWNEAKAAIRKAKGP